MSLLLTIVARMRRASLSRCSTVYRHALGKREVHGCGKLAREQNAQFGGEWNWAAVHRTAAYRFGGRERNEINGSGNYNCVQVFPFRSKLVTIKKGDCLSANISVYVIKLYLVNMKSLHSQEKCTFDLLPLSKNFWKAIIRKRVRLIARYWRLNQYHFPIKNPYYNI